MLCFIDLSCTNLMKMPLLEVISEIQSHFYIYRLSFKKYNWEWLLASSIVIDYIAITFIELIFCTDIFISDSGKCRENP